MNQHDAYVREGDSVSEVISMPIDRHTDAKIGTLRKAVAPLSVNWHGNCTNIGVSKFLDWLVL
jgi:hypothetical protein